MTEEKEHKEAERLQVHTLETAERAAAQENAKLLQDLHAELAQAALSFLTFLFFTGKLLPYLFGSCQRTC